MELNNLILRTGWLALTVGLIIAFVEAVFKIAPLDRVVDVALSGGIPLTLITATIRWKADFKFNHYLVALGCSICVLSIYFFTGDWVLFYIVLFVESMLSFYQDQLLVAFVVAFQGAVFTAIFFFDRSFTVTMPERAVTLSDIYISLLMGGLVFGVMSKFVLHLTDRIKNEEKFHQMLDSALEAVIGMDGLGRINNWNPQAGTLFGWTEKEAIGRSFFSLLVPGEDRRKLENGLADFSGGDKGTIFGRKFEAVVFGIGGMEIQVEMVVAPVRVGEGPPPWEFVAYVEDISERKRYEGSLLLLANQDGLTGLLNHREFQRRLQEEAERANRYGRPLSLMLFDVDNFKDINDANGHMAGDAVLKGIGKILLELNRTSDLSARYGGDEFAVLLPEVDGEAAAEAARRLQLAVAKYPFGEEGGEVLPVTLSIGVATKTEKEMVEVAVLLRSADKALYGAKEGGRNRVEVAV